jgi:hypothetical protein
MQLEVTHGHTQQQRTAMEEEEGTYVEIAARCGTLGQVVGDRAGSRVRLERRID